MSRKSYRTPRLIAIGNPAPNTQTPADAAPGWAEAEADSLNRSPGRPGDWRLPRPGRTKRLPVFASWIRIGGRDRARMKASRD